MIRYILVNLVGHRSVDLTGKSSVYHPIGTLRACNSFQSGVGGVEGSGVEEGVVNTLLNLKSASGLLKTLISLYNTTSDGNTNET